MAPVYTFPAASVNVNGSGPTGGLIKAPDGNFYGTTAGGAATPSTVDQITPSGTLTTLHTFGAPSVIFRDSTLMRGSDGNFYGTTVNDGANGYGTVFQITPAGVFTDLHDFTEAEGYQGYGAPLQGSDGNFYGGANGFGTVYQLTPAGVLTVLVEFNAATDSSYPKSRSDSPTGPPATRHRAKRPCGLTKRKAARLPAASSPSTLPGGAA